MSEDRRPADHFEDELASFLRHEASRADTLSGVPDAASMTTLVAARAKRRTMTLAPVTAAAAVAVLLVTGLLGSLVLTRQGQDGPMPGGLLDAVATRGSIRIAVRPDFPQAVAAGLAGYDLDVAQEVTRRLGLGWDRVIRAPDEMLRPEDVETIDLAAPSDGRLSTDPRISAASSLPYYHWPVYLVVPDDRPAESPADLTGASICVEAGSSGESWTDGRYDGPSSTDVVPPPASVMVRREETDRDCLSLLDRGEVDGLVTSTLGPADLAARRVRTVGGPVLTEPRSFLALRVGLDPTDLLAEIDRTLSEMHADGTLAGLSRNRFGGRDLTVPES